MSVCLPLTFPRYDHDGNFTRNPVAEGGNLANPPGVTTAVYLWTSVKEDEEI